MSKMTALDPIIGKSYILRDKVGRLMDNITDRWLLTIREENPAILDMFKDAGQKPYRNLLNWSGEFAGKYITNAVLVYSMTRDERLKDYLSRFIGEMISYQKEDGYLGPWPEGFELTGRKPVTGYTFDTEFRPDENDIDTWDAWSHYHIMYGLLLWHRETGDKAALACVMRIAGLFLRKFYRDGGARLWDTGWQEMNLAPIHSFTLLYELTGEKEYLDFALEVAKDFEKPPAGDYIRCALAGKEYFEMPKPRWESLHSIQGIAELYIATGDEKYKTAFENIWRSILKTDVHNTGAFSTREQAVGNPYEYGAIETCCVIAYMAATVDMLRISGDSIAADVLEIATYNSSLGSFSPSGRWSTYNTPMEGYKRANYHDIVFQSRPGSPDLNCCSVNAPRAFGMISEWGVMTGGDVLYINYYGEGTVGFTDGGRAVTLTQKTAYPYNGKVKIEMTGFGGAEKAVCMRIPFWADGAEVLVNGEVLAKPVAGSYYKIERSWADGDKIELDLGMPLRFWAGDGRLDGKCSVYRGPVLLCLDPHYNPGMDFENRPAFDAKTMRLLSLDTESAPGALFLFADEDGKEVTLCDMFTAGIAGTPYTTWLDVKNATKTAFTRENPFRMVKA